MMEKNRMVKRILAVVLLVIAVIGLNMQGMSVFAETLQPEGLSETTEVQSEEQSETTEVQSEGQGETTVSQPESLKETSEEGESEEQAETVDEQSVNGNDISEEDAKDQDGTVAVLVDGDTENGDAEADNTDNELKLTDAILEECIVEGMNPPGVTVNLFDYSQGDIPDGSREVAHDYYYKWSIWDDKINEMVPDVEKDPYVTTYNLGISKNHLLRFGYRGNDKYDYCETITAGGIQLGDYGTWNEYHTGRWFGIVRNRLYDGFPRLNLSNESNYGRYADTEDSSAYFTEDNMTESLAYLFSPNVPNQYKESYIAVQGLFRQRADGYYYYDSRLNFASINKSTNSFTLYNSPGVAKETEGNIYSGQFFPFNTAYDVFDSYIENNDGSYQLAYQDIKKQGEGNSDYDPIEADGNSYIKCYAPNLNHYLGLTLEMSFVQPVGGRVNGDTGASDMIFEFSGDDDVWIFIDDVLVADLGGIHDALKLSINFATGEINVEGEKRTLYDFFVTAYGENSNLGGVEFNGNTFADNTTHTLKMFYLERGHLASNLSLSFNIQPLQSPPSNNEDNGDKEDNEYKEDNGDKEDNEDKDENIYETVENTHDSYTDANVDAKVNVDTNANTVVEIPVSDKMLIDSTEIPKTGDDSLIGWWAALCIISLVGISATVCNLIIRKRKQDN
ncbi:MAG: hypothetical protein K2N85_15935 [Lachnospiraceae bacterium]|nr:hypothetical protein [Lachnospiraceae bacterium]